jgi:hypothetical protein
VTLFFRNLGLVCGLNDTQKQDIKMEKMKINSKIRYNRARVRSGHGPHKMLKMVQNQMYQKLPKTEKQDEVKE